MYRGEKMKEIILDRNIVTEMETSFLDYSMSVIVSRALPDVRDGLKPVHRRILYAMHALSLTNDKPFKKSARIVGDVVGKYHPHGDTAVYDSMVRMVQDFAYRFPLVEGHGNFGSIDGYGAAAMRYTEARLAKISNELLRDINKDTVDYTLNYDGQEKEPTVFPSRFPNILVNGAMGIAVGMATNIPPHNLGEVIDGCVAVIDNGEITNMELCEHIKGPDFPTGAMILGTRGIRQAYETGRGSITIRSKIDVEESNGKYKLIIKEIPFQTNKTNLITKIANLVKEKELEGISGLTDETDLKGIKIVIELKKEANPNVVLNNLYKSTGLQTTFGINVLALVEGRPQLLSIKEVLSKYLEHQKIVIIRRSNFELEKSENRMHILSGLKKALDNIDQVIKIIKQAKSEPEAIATLIKEFAFTQVQSEAILEMKLRRLTGLEREKIDEEMKNLQELINHLKELLSDEGKIMQLIKSDLIEVKEKYNNPRRTEIDLTTIEQIEDESLIPVTKTVVTLTYKGYVKRIDEETYKTQNRGGVGVKGVTTNEEDFVEQIISCLTHDFILFFTNKGKVYRLKGYEIPLYSRQAKGLPVVNLFAFEEGERVSAVLKVGRDEENDYFVFCTKGGIVKRSKILEFESIRTNGKIALTLKEGDELIGVKKTKGDSEVLIGSSQGRMVRFLEKEIRVMGRTAAGVKGISLDGGQCIGCEVSNENDLVLIVTSNGYGKCSKMDEYRQTKRGAKGVKALNVTEKNGPLVSFKMVSRDDDLMVVSNSGIIIRVPITQIPTLRRATQGVRVINLKNGQSVANIAVIRADHDVPRETSE